MILVLRNKKKLTFTNKYGHDIIIITFLLLLTISHHSTHIQTPYHQYETSRFYRPDDLIDTTILFLQHTQGMQLRYPPHSILQSL